MTWSLDWVARLLDLVAPRPCSVCGRRLAVSEHTLCTACLLRLPRTSFLFSPRDNPMAQLFYRLAPVQRAAALVYYEPRAESARVVHAMKYYNSPDAAEDVGRLMAAEALLAGFLEGVDVVVPVPLSPRRLRQRGYNQSALLARGIGDAARLPVADGVLGRSHFRRSQTELTRQQRRENVSGLFYLRDSSPLRGGRHVLLVDDICTTGATLLAAIAPLLAVEGLRVSVLTYGFTKA